VPPMERNELLFLCELTAARRPAEFQRQSRRTLLLNRHMDTDGRVSANASIGADQGH
jgi:hypothetical protein